MLRTAIELKQAIDKIDDHIKPIGSCPLDIFSWEHEERGKYYELEEYESEDWIGYDDSDSEYKKWKYVRRCNETINLISNIKAALKSKFYHTFNIDNSLNISILGENLTLDLSQEKLKELFYHHSKAAPFGDMKKMETVVDQTVRHARYIDKFTLGDEILDAIAQEWSKSMYPKQVRVEPYRINMYGKDGHFKSHKDTPSKGLVGTALLALSDDYGKNLNISSPYDEDDRNFRWCHSAGDAIMFYSDCPHHVGKSWREDIRCSVAFKIYSDDTGKDEFEEKIKLDKTVKAIQKFEEVNSEGQYGFILGHSYSLETEALKGEDAILVRACQELGREFMIIPIVHKYEIYSYHEENCEDEEIWSKVYPLTESHINHILDHSKDYDLKDLSGINFYTIKGEDYVWKNQYQNYCEHVGNQCQAEEQNSLYLNRALIILN